MKRYPVITISREYGSAGHEIARQLAQRLDIPYYDNDLIAMAASDSGIAAERFEQAEDTATNAFAFALKSVGGAGLTTMPLNNRMFLIQSAFIRTIADTGPAVIVGRCADYVLDGYADCFNVFISADFSSRVARTAEKEHLSPAEAEKVVKKKDKSRATYYAFYTDRRWGDLANYDLTINSSVLGIEATTDLIEFAVKRLAEE